MIILILLLKWSESFYHSASTLHQMGFTKSALRGLF